MRSSINSLQIEDDATMVENYLELLILQAKHVFFQSKVIWIFAQKNRHYNLRMQIKRVGAKIQKQDLLV